MFFESKGTNIKRHNKNRSAALGIASYGQLPLPFVHGMALFITILNTSLRIEMTLEMYFPRHTMKLDRANQHLIRMKYDNQKRFPLHKSTHEYSILIPQSWDWHA